MTVVMILGGFDLSIGAIAAVTGLGAVLIFGTGDPLFLALGCLACIGTGALIGAFNGTLISRIGINPLIATLAMASLVRGPVLITSEGTIHRAEGDAMWITTLADWVKASVWPGWHVCGTCRMGPDGDPLAVLDGECRVRGVAGLRVVDASVMPTIPRANTNLTTIAIAEKIADWLRMSS